MSEQEHGFFLALVHFQVSPSLKEKEKLMLEITDLKHSDAPAKLGDQSLEVLDQWWPAPNGFSAASPCRDGKDHSLAPGGRPGIIAFPCMTREALIIG